MPALPHKTPVVAKRHTKEQTKGASIPFKPIEKQPRLLALQNLQATLKQPRFPSSHMHARTQTLEDTQAAAKPQLCKHKKKRKSIVPRYHKHHRLWHKRSFVRECDTVTETPRIPAWPVTSFDPWLARMQLTLGGRGGVAMQEKTAATEDTEYRELHRLQRYKHAQVSLPLLIEKTSLHS